MWNYNVGFRPGLSQRTSAEQSHDAFFRCRGHELLELLHNFPERFFGRTVRLAGFLAKELPGCGQNGPSPSIGVPMLVCRIDKVFCQDSAPHLQPAEIRVKLSAHLRSSKAARCPQLACGHALVFLQREQNHFLYAACCYGGCDAAAEVHEIRPPSVADEASLPQQEFAIGTAAFLNDV